MFTRRLFLIGVPLLLISVCLFILILLSTSPRGASQPLSLTPIPTCLGGCGALPTTIGNSPIGFLSVVDEWPVQMNINDSDNISIRLVVPSISGLYNYLAKRGNYEEAKARPLLPGHQNDTLNTAFGSGYEVFATSRLYGENFNAQLTGAEMQTVEQSSIEWDWNISPNKQGRQVVDMEIDILWKSTKASQMDISLPIWRAHVFIQVNQAFLDVSQFTIPTLLGFFSGLGLTIPWLWEQIEKIVEERKKKSAQKKPVSKEISRRRVINELGWTALLVALGGVSMWIRSSIVISSSISVGKLLHAFKLTASVSQVGWSSDGSRIAAGSFDRTVRVWEATSGHNVITYNGHSDSVNSVTWSPDGRYIASGSTDTTVQIWEAASGNYIRGYNGHAEEVITVAWSSNGSRIASADTASLQIWDAMSGNNFLTYYSYNFIHEVAWSPDNNSLACSNGSSLISGGGNANTVQIWDVGNSSVLFTYRGHSADVITVVWSPDGRRVGSGGFDNTVQIWEAD